MSDSNKTAWKESVVKVWAPIAGVISALKVLLFDLPQIYHKVAGAVSLTVIGNILKYTGVLILLFVIGTSPHKEYQSAMRIVTVLLAIGFLWYERNDASTWEFTAFIGWLALIGIIISIGKDDPQKQGD